MKKNILYSLVASSLLASGAPAQEAKDSVVIGVDDTAALRDYLFKQIKGLEAGKTLTIDGGSFTFNFKANAIEPVTAEPGEKPEVTLKKQNAALTAIMKPSLRYLYLLAADFSFGDMRKDYCAKMLRDDVIDPVFEHDENGKKRLRPQLAEACMTGKLGITYWYEEKIRFCFGENHQVYVVFLYNQSLNGKRVAITTVDQGRMIKHEGSDIATTDPAIRPDNENFSCAAIIRTRTAAMSP